MTTVIGNAASETSALVSLVRLGRPKFLLGGLALFGLGNLTAYLMGYGFDLKVYIWGQLIIMAIQLMTHYSNDYFDLEADRENHHPTQWSGGSRVLVEGELPRWCALATALALACAACIATAGLLSVRVQTKLALFILASIFVLSWSYSSPPLRLHSRGLGEPAVAIVVPFLTPLSGFVLQAGQLERLPVLLCLPLVLLQLAMLLTLQIPDASGDRAVGKLTWTVLFGARPIAFLCILFILAAFLLGLSSSALGVPGEVRWAWVILAPLGLLQLTSYLRRDFERPEAFNRLAFGSTALFFLAIVGEIIAIALASDLLSLRE